MAPPGGVLYYMLVNFTKLHVILLALVIGFTPVLFSQETSTDLELKSIQKQISRTEKLTKNKAIRSDLKRSRRELDRIRELWKLGAVPNSLGLLLDVRATLYKYGSSESQAFQENIHSVMTRLWPFLLKTERFRTDIQKRSGVTYVRIIMPEGAYTLSFPEDAKPGEIISGRIQAAPPESASMYLLTMMGSPIVPDGNLRKWNLPESFDLVLSDPWSNEIVRTTYKLNPIPAEPEQTSGNPELQVEKEPKEPKQNIEIPHLRFEISSNVKAGGHLIVKGPFDGDFNNTLVAVGQYQGFIVTESPGRLVLLIHPSMTGDWTVLVGENENRVRCRIKVQKEEVDPFSTISTCMPPRK